MRALSQLQKLLIKAYFDRTGDGILPEHIIPTLEKTNNYETLLQDAQRYLSDLYATKYSKPGF